MLEVLLPPYLPKWHDSLPNKHTLAEVEVSSLKEEEKTTKKTSSGLTHRTKDFKQGLV